MNTFNESYFHVPNQRVIRFGSHIRMTHNNRLCVANNTNNGGNEMMAVYLFLLFTFLQFIDGIFPTEFQYVYVHCTWLFTVYGLHYYYFIQIFRITWIFIENCLSFFNVVFVHPPPFIYFLCQLNAIMMCDNNWIFSPIWVWASICGAPYTVHRTLK